MAGERAGRMLGVLVGAALATTAPTETGDSLGRLATGYAYLLRRVAETTGGGLLDGRLERRARVALS